MEFHGLSTRTSSWISRGYPLDFLRRLAGISSSFPRLFFVFSGLWIASALLFPSFSFPFPSDFPLISPFSRPISLCPSPLRPIMHAGTKAKKKIDAIAQQLDRFDQLVRPVNSNRTLSDRIDLSTVGILGDFCRSFGGKLQTRGLRVLRCNLCILQHKSPEQELNLSGS